MKEKKARVISVLNFKGGVGKTTTVLNLGAAMALRGKDVLIIDLDDQTNTSNVLGYSIQDGASVLDVLRGTVESFPIYDTNYEHMKFIPASRKLADFATEIKNYTRREETLKRCIEPLLCYFDYVLIDCPPNLDIYPVNAMCASDSILVPMSCKVMTMQGFFGIMEKYKELKRLVNTDLEIEGFLLTMYRQRGKATNMITDYLNGQGVRVFDTKIRECSALDFSSGEYQSVFDYDARCNGAKDYAQLAEEIIMNNK